MSKCVITFAFMGNHRVYIIGCQLLCGLDAGPMSRNPGKVVIHPGLHFILVIHIQESLSKMA